jgi:hypothetical protein
MVNDDLTAAKRTAAHAADPRHQAGAPGANACLPIDHATEHSPWPAKGGRCSTEPAATWGSWTIVLSTCTYRLKPIRDHVLLARTRKDPGFGVESGPGSSLLGRQVETLEVTHLAGESLGPFRPGFQSGKED